MVQAAGRHLVPMRFSFVREFVENERHTFGAERLRAIHDLEVQVG